MTVQHSHRKLISFLGGGLFLCGALAQPARAAAIHQMDRLVGGDLVHKNIRIDASDFKVLVHPGGQVKGHFTAYNSNQCLPSRARLSFQIECRDQGAVEGAAAAAREVADKEEGRRITAQTSVYEFPVPPGGKPFPTSLQGVHILYAHQRGQALPGAEVMYPIHDVVEVRPLLTAKGTTLADFFCYLTTPLRRHPVLCCIACPCLFFIAYKLRKRYVASAAPIDLAVAATNRLAKRSARQGLPRPAAARGKIVKES